MGLQTALGELRDCDLWIEDLGARLDRHRVESAGSDADSNIRLAAIWLLNYFTKERTRHFRSALARWHKWETGGFFERMLEVLGEERAAAAEDEMVAAEPTPAASNIPKD